MTGQRAGAWTRTSRVIKARPEELYAAFLDPAALIDWLPPAEMTGEIHRRAGRGRRRTSALSAARRPTKRTWSTEAKGDRTARIL
jgi:uncharacterized protein YndB with AHSA1/START domain